MQISLSPYHNNLEANTSFNGRQAINRLALKYGDDLLGILNSKRFFVSKDIIKLTNNTVPGVKVKLKRFCPSDGNSYCRFKTENVPKFSVKQQEIYVDKPFFKLSEKENKIKFISAMVHEVTHALQNTDKDFSEIKLLNDFIKTYPNKEVSKASAAANYIFAAIEQKIVPFFMFTKCLNNEQYIYMSKKEITKILKKLAPEIKKEFLTSKEYWSNEIQKTPLKKNKDCIMSLISLSARQEADAYTNEVLFRKKLAGINQRDGIGIVPIIYKIFSDVFTPKKHSIH